MHLPFLVKVKKLSNYRSSSGFTLVEMVAVILAIGILAGIAVPGWLRFINRQKVKTAQSTALTLLREAQASAKREKVRWQACFWDDGNQVLASVHRANPSTNECQTTNGTPLIQGDSKAIKFTSTFRDDPSNYYLVQFKYDGSVNGQMGKLTFTPRNTNDSKRCVIVSTLLGAMRFDKDDKCDKSTSD